ncbi:MAG: ImmA/IrrE family metallo-endopeptidase [Candidatus Krumholzibacteriia bacterium]
MIKRIANEYVPTDVSAPGETLSEILTERGISQTDLADRMGRPKKTINEIMNGKAAITPQTALELELVLRIPAEFWIARERDYRTYLARRDQEECFAKDVSWARRFPAKEMIEFGWMPQHVDKSALVRNLLEFFGVASSQQWEQVFSVYQVAFRKPKAFKPDLCAISAWLRAGISSAEKSKMKPFDRDAFRDALRESRKLITSDPEDFVPALTGIFAEAGVAVAFIPELPKSRASGATMWLSPERALIQLSLRYKSDDQLWFTFFHEAAHVLLHGKKSIFLETGEHLGEQEKEANEWAANFLIPASEYRHFVSVGGFSKAEIRAFAAQLGISPGIVVGRLQHDGVLDFANCNDLKRRLKWVKDN